MVLSAQKTIQRQKNYPKNKIVLGICENIMGRGNKIRFFRIFALTISGLLGMIFTRKIIRVNQKGCGVPNLFFPYQGRPGTSPPPVREKRDDCP